MALGFSQLTLNDNFSSGVRQIHCGTNNGLDFASHAVHDIATFALGNSNCMVHHLIIIRNDSVFGARIIDHLIVASNKQFFTDGVNLTIFALILIFGDNLNINTGNLGQLNGTEDKTTLGGSYESFSGLREHHFRTMDITLIAIFILQNTVLQALQSDGLAHITLAVVIILGNDLNTSRRNIEGNLSALDNKDLTIYILLLGILNDITLSISHFTGALGSLFSFIDSCQKILVRTQRMTLDNLCHLTGIQRKTNRAAHIDLTADMNIFGKIIGARLRMLIALNGILQNSVPVLRRSYE